LEDPARSGALAAVAGFIVWPGWNGGMLGRGEYKRVPCRRCSKVMQEALIIEDTDAEGKARTKGEDNG